MNYANNESMQGAIAAKACYDGPSLRRPDLKEDLTNQLQRANAEVARLNELLALLDKNTDTQRILELLRG